MIEATFAAIGALATALCLLGIAALLLGARHP